MGQVRWASWMVAVVAALALGGVSAQADVTSDRAAAILIWPNIEVGPEEATDFWENGHSPYKYDDTVVQLSNTSTSPVSLHCFYENANSHCEGGDRHGLVCKDARECCSAPPPPAPPGGGGAGSGFCGTCEPGWNETDFRIHLTPRQPMGWLASEGLAGFLIQGRRPDNVDLQDVGGEDLFGKLKLDGQFFVGIDGSSNAGTRIPPVPEIPFNGSLRCIVIDETGNPIDSNVVKGEATLINRSNEPVGHDVTRHNAIGIQAIEGANNGDNKLCLGGEVSEECPEGSEYNGCPKVIELNHFFDFAASPVNGDTIETRLVMVPCTQDYRRQEPGSAVIQYLVYNEFEQRFSTSKSMECKQDLFISELDRATGSQRERSIFSAGVAGTISGQTRAQAIGSGVLAMGNEWHGYHSADFNSHFMANGRQDVITLP